jgi:hypothetical protein
LTDGRSESVLETLVRVCLVSRGIAPPTPQAWIETSGGWFRVDLLWPAERVIVEVDGLGNTAQAGIGSWTRSAGRNTSKAPVTAWCA